MSNKPFGFDADLELGLNSRTPPLNLRSPSDILSSIESTELSENIEDSSTSLPAEQEIFFKEVDTLTHTINCMLKCKNLQYGNASLEPINIFSRLTPSESIKARIDDKPKRMKNSDTIKVDTVFDLLGYMSLLLISMGKINIEDVQDIDVSILNKVKECS